MSHKCIIDGSSAVCIEVNEELWVKEHYDGKSEGRTYKVNFCPECGFKLPTKSFFNFLHLPYSQPDESISQFSHTLSISIAQMNHNVEMIKAFMCAQNAQNEYFIINNNELKKSIEDLQEKIKVLVHKKPTNFKTSMDIC